MVPFDLERRVGQIPPVSLFRVFALSRRVSVGLETAFPLCGNVVEFNLRFSLEIVCFHPGAACASLVARTCCSRCSRARCSRAARRADRCTPDGVPGAPMRRTGGLLAFSRAVCLELASGSWVAQRDESTKQTKKQFRPLGFSCVGAQRPAQRFCWRPVLGPLSAHRDAELHVCVGFCLRVRCCVVLFGCFGGLCPTLLLHSSGCQMH